MPKKKTVRRTTPKQRDSKRLLASMDKAEKALQSLVKSFRDNGFKAVHNPEVAKVRRMADVIAGMDPRLMKHTPDKK